MPDLERGERIRDARIKAGLSQTAFAEAAGVSKRAQIRYEQGDSPTADYLAAIDKMGVDVSVVLTGKTVEERRALLEDRLGALKVTTDRAMGLTSDMQKGELIRDILLADRWGKPEIAEAAIERYVAVRSSSAVKQRVKGKGNIVAAGDVTTTTERGKKR